MATVRRAKLTDIPAMVAMGRSFHAESPYCDEPYSESAVHQFLADSMVKTAERAVFVAEDKGEIVGACCTAVSQLYFTTDTRYASELFWFVKAGHRGGSVGLRLLAAMEDWAAEKDCTYNVIVSFNGKTPRSYEPVESASARRLH